VFQAWGLAYEKAMCKLPYDIVVADTERTKLAEYVGHCPSLSGNLLHHCALFVLYSHINGHPVELSHRWCHVFTHS